MHEAGLPARGPTIAPAPQSADAARDGVAQPALSPPRANAAAPGTMSAAGKGDFIPPDAAPVAAAGTGLPAATCQAAAAIGMQEAASQPAAGPNPIPPPAPPQRPSFVQSPLVSLPRPPPPLPQQQQQQQQQAVSQRAATLKLVPLPAAQRQPDFVPSPLMSPPRPQQQVQLLQVCQAILRCCTDYCSSLPASYRQ